jgi:hypothetical protein
MFRLPRMALVLLLAAILSTTALLAASGPGTQPRRSVISASASIDLVSQLWSVLARVWSKNGSQVDPNGVPTKNGSQMDPDGRTLPTSAPVTPNRDNGHQVDLDG